MHSSCTGKGRCIGLAAAVFILLAAVGVLAQNDDRKINSPGKSTEPSRREAPSRPSSAPSRPAAPSRSEAPSRPAPSPPRFVAAPPSGASRGPVAGGTHQAPPNDNPGVHRGAAANEPANGHTSFSASRPAAEHNGHPASEYEHSRATANAPVGRRILPTASHPNSNESRTMGEVDSHRREVEERHGVANEHAIHNGFLGRPEPRGSREIQLRNGSVVARRPDGRVRDLHDARRGMDVHHGIYGNTRVIVERHDHTWVYAERGRPGYVQRGYIHNGHEYARRTYYYHGQAYDRYYRRYPYRGVYIQVYAPVRYYPVGFYGWAYGPWHHPVAYSWGWGGSPWYGYYGSYFTPYPVYPTASLWLTDYIISSELAAAYQARQEAQQEAQIQMDQEAAAGSAPLTPEVKQRIADEVKNQLALENTEAQQNARQQELDPNSSSIATLLSDGKTHVFVAGSSLDVVDAAGMECAISDGDALELATPPPPSATSADLVMLSSKGGRECAKADTVSVTLADLQEMQNHMRETIDQGLQELQAKQGTGELPAAPASANGTPVSAPFANDAPPPDPNGASEVNQQLAEADQAEKDVVGEAQQETGAPAANPTTIALGQTIEQVTTALGPPLTVIDLGSKKIYKYKDMKVTFTDGKVSDAE